MERTFDAENGKARKRLAALGERIGPGDLERDAGGGWKVSTIFAHLAFWDHRTLILLRRWKRSGVAPSPVDTDGINEALAPFLNAVPSRAAVSMALDLSEAVCGEIAGVPDGMAAEIEAVDRKRLHRYAHWNMHIDQIEKILRPG